MEKSTDIHKEVVTGIVQVIKYLADRRGEAVNFGVLFKAGFRGRTEDAQDYICEFVKDGLLNLRKVELDEVVNGNYEKVWAATNNYLKRFGHTPVEPEPISPEFTDK